MTHNSASCTYSSHFLFLSHLNMYTSSESRSPSSSMCHIKTSFRREGPMPISFLDGVSRRVVNMIREERMEHTFSPMICQPELCQMAFAYSRYNYLDAVRGVHRPFRQQLEVLPCKHVAFMSTFAEDRLDRSEVAGELLFFLRTRRVFLDFMQRDAIFYGVSVCGDSSRFSICLVVSNNKELFANSF